MEFTISLLFGPKNKPNSQATMNHQYYLICRLYVRSGGQEQLNDIRKSDLCSFYERRRPVILQGEIE